MAIKLKLAGVYADHEVAIKQNGSYVQAAAAVKVAGAYVPMSDGGSPSFDIASLYSTGVFHWDASDASTITESAGEATQLRDKSGNGNHVNFSVAGKRPLTGATLNGVSCLDFRADKYGLPTSAPMLFGPREVFAVVWSDRAAGGDNASILRMGSSSTTQSHIWTAKTQLGGTSLAGSDVTRGNGTMRHTLIQHSYNDDAQTTQYLWIDGRLRSGAVSSTAASATSMGVGASSTGVVPLNGLLGEIFVANKRLTSTERANVIAYLTAKWRPLTAVTKYHVVIIAGQSNARGAYGPVNRTTDAPDRRIAMLEREYTPSTGVVIENANGEVVLAEHPLSNRWRDTASPPPEDSVGPGMAYAKALLATLPADEGVLLIPCAQGSTYAAASCPFTGDVTWHPAPTKGTNPPYTDTIARANRILALGSKYQLHSMIWCQGEADSATTLATTQASHAANIDAIIGGLRAGITGGSSLKTVVVNIPEFLNAGTYDKAPLVRAAIADTPNRLTKCAFVASTGMTDGGDSLHYDAASCRSLGAAAFTAYGTIL